MNAAHTIVVSAICASCPCCGHGVELDEMQIEEWPDGSFFVRTEERYRTCPECDHNFDCGVMGFSPIGENVNAQTQ